MSQAPSTSVAQHNAAQVFRRTLVVPLQEILRSMFEWGDTMVEVLSVHYNDERRLDKQEDKREGLRRLFLGIR